MPITKKQYQEFGLPALAILETVLTKGASPGTTAMGQQEVLRKGEDRLRADQETARKRALEKRTMGREDLEFEQGQTKFKQGQQKFDLETEQAAIASAALKRAKGELTTDITAAGSDPNKQRKAIQKYMLSVGNPSQIMSSFAAPKKSLEEVFASGLDMNRKKQEQAAEIKSQAAGKESIKETKINFAKSKSLLRVLWKKKQAQLQEGVPGGGFGRGLIREGGAALRLEGFPATAAFDGQRTETAIGLMRVLTGQNRAVESILAQIKKSLPDGLDPQGIAASKIAQSVENGFGLVKAMEKQGITNRELAKFSQKELSDPNSPINQRISSITPEELDANEKLEARAAIIDVLGFDPDEGGSEVAGQTPPADPIMQELIRRAKAGDTKAQQGLTQRGIRF